MQELHQMKKDEELVNIVNARKMQYLGPIMWSEYRYGLLQSIRRGRTTSRRGPGREEFCSRPTCEHSLTKVQKNSFG